MNNYSRPIQIRYKGCSLTYVTAQALQSMEIFSLISLGLFLGMTHAMDADHITAVSAMWSRQDGKQAWIDQRVGFTGALAMPLSFAGAQGTIFGKLFSAITACLCL